MFSYDMDTKDLLLLPVTGFPGIGIKRGKAFHNIGIYNAGDLLRHFPRAYEHRGNVKKLSECVDGETVALLLTVSSVPQTAYFRNRMKITKFSAFDESGKCTVTFFNQDYVRSSFEVGGEFRFWGKITVKGGRKILTSPKFERYSENITLAEFVPVYPSGAGLTQKIISDAIKMALELAEKHGVDEVLPQRLRDKWALPDAFDAYKKIHHPESFDDINLGREYFSYEEMYIFALGLSFSKGQRDTGKAYKMNKVDMSLFANELEYELTGAQKRAINEIYADMVIGKHGDTKAKTSEICDIEKRGIAPMARLVSGDVGCGKTVIAAAAIYIALANGYQAALMAPTEILATQHYNDLSPLFEKLGYKCALLTGSLKESEKRKVKEGLSSLEISFVCGTHALISSGVEFGKIGLVVTDEQHRFGVMQRAKLGGSSAEREERFAASVDEAENNLHGSYDTNDPSEGGMTADESGGNLDRYGSSLDGCGMALGKSMVDPDRSDVALNGSGIVMDRSNMLTNENGITSKISDIVFDGSIVSKDASGMTSGESCISQNDSLGAEREYLPHVLVMSATPIPRTLALILYGDLDVSTVDEMPPGRQRVDTFVVNESYRDRLNGFIRKCVNDGGQVYIVCPAVEESDEELSGSGEFIDISGMPSGEKDKPRLKTAVEYAKHLGDEVFPEFRVEFMHGKLKGAEKDRVMREFAEGNIQILVSTTVIEVGVNVPNASLMIVENAERFGLSQLHQLRGRVGRGKRKAYCVLVSESKDKGNENTAAKRLEIMRTTYNGYKIAEYDLEMRGPGDFFPGSKGEARQHGGFKLNFVSLDADMTRVKDAFSEAELTLCEDPMLQSAANSSAALRIKDAFKIDVRAMQ